MFNAKCNWIYIYFLNGDRQSGFKTTWDCLEEIHFKFDDIGWLKVSGLKRIYHANIYQKKARVALLILYKVDVTAKKITRSKNVHYIIL